MEHNHAMPHDQPDHHAHMAADFRKRFWLSLILTLPILALSPMLQKLVGLRGAIHFNGDIYVLFALSSAVFWYGGWPFLKGLVGKMFFWELASLIDIMLLRHWIEMKSVMGAALISLSTVIVAINARLLKIK